MKKYICESGHSFYKPAIIYDRILCDPVGTKCPVCGNMTFMSTNEYFDANNISVVVDEGGVLYLRRGDRYIGQSCPYRKQNCGDHCPLFAGPVKVDGSVNLSLCNGHNIAIKADEFFDMRGEPK